MEKSLDIFFEVLLSLNGPQTGLVICRRRQTVQLGAGEEKW